MVVADVRGEGGDGDGDVCFAQALRLIAISPGAHKINFVQWYSSTSESGKLTDFSPDFDKWCSASVTHAVADTNFQHVSVLFYPHTWLERSSLSLLFAISSRRTKMERKTFSLPTLMMGSDWVYEPVWQTISPKKKTTRQLQKKLLSKLISLDRMNMMSLVRLLLDLKKILISSFYSFVSWRETRKAKERSENSIAWIYERYVSMRLDDSRNQMKVEARIFPFSVALWYILRFSFYEILSLYLGAFQSHLKFICGTFSSVD